MPDRIRVACVQLTSRQDKAANLDRAEALIARAASTGADVVVLPEKWNLIGSADDYRAGAEPLEGGESMQAMSGWARTLGITLVGGSITERREGREKLSNTCCVFDPEGALVAVYRKIHLFDVEVGGHVYRESEAEEPGDRAGRGRARRTGASGSRSATTCASRSCTASSRSRAPSSSTVPAHFTTPTGKDHWHVLLRARAIENQCYVAAAGQVGERSRQPAYGRSLIVDPWGTVLAQAPDEETVIVAELDRTRLRDIRAKLPSLANRQPDAYRRPSAVTLDEWLPRVPRPARRVRRALAAAARRAVTPRAVQAMPCAPTARRDACGLEALESASRDRAGGRRARALGRRRGGPAARARRRASCACCSSGASRARSSQPGPATHSAC